MEAEAETTTAIGLAVQEMAAPVLSSSNTPCPHLAARRFSTHLVRGLPRQAFRLLIIWWLRVVVEAAQTILLAVAEVLVVFALEQVFL